jgi:hypothetical protein
VLPTNDIEENTVALLLPLHEGSTSRGIFDTRLKAIRKKAIPPAPTNDGT